jgi:hypothetical protein
MRRHWKPRTPTLYGYTIPPAEPGKTMWRPTSAIRRAENAIHERRLARRLARRYVQLAPGTLIVWERQPWQVVSVDERPDDLWETKHEEEYAHHLKLCDSRGFAKPDRHTWRGRPMAVQIVPVGNEKADPVHLIAPGHHQWDVLPEHYAVCAACGELPPCHHEDAEKEADLIAARNDVLMDIPPGHCLACGEHITGRQKADRFPGPNLWRPDLPENSAVFHARLECAGPREKYRTQWLQRGNEDAQTVLSLDQEGDTQ